jgi:hypothetical protein
MRAVCLTKYASGKTISMILCRFNVEAFGLTVEPESSKGSNPNQQRAENLCTLPWIRSSPPTQTNEEKYHASGEEEDTAVIKFSQLLTLSFSLDMELGVGRRVIHELIEHKCDDGKDDS